MRDDQYSFQKLPSHLLVGELLALCSILGFLALITAISLLVPAQYEDSPSADRHHLQSQQIEVYIQGAVALPGSYVVPIGTLLGDVVAMAEPLPQASLTAARLRSRVRHGQLVSVPAKEMIKIAVSGAVEKRVVVEVPRGTRLRDLGRFVAYLPQADLAKMDRGRHLRNSEEVVVPYKKPLKLKRPEGRKRGK